VKLQRIETKGLNRVYVKYQVVIPTHMVTQLGWQGDDEVNFEIDRRRRLFLQAHPATQSTQKEKRMGYDEFRKEVHRILISAPDGLTWTEICEKGTNLPARPSALWVRRLESDIGLKRLPEAKTYRKIWKTEDPSKLNGYIQSTESIA